jgi:hypothetical protein
MTTVFLLTVMLGNIVVNRDLYFENINSCLYFSGRLNDQPNIPRRDSEKDRITAYCLPTTVDTSKIKVHR